MNQIKKRSVTYNRSRRNSKTLQDYLDVLPSSNTIKKIGDNRIITNCVGHEDNNPSMAISEGKTRVVFKCFAGCDQTKLSSFFNEKFGGRS
jgi:DNA primase